MIACGIINIFLLYLLIISYVNLEGTIIYSVFFIIGSHSNGILGVSHTKNPINILFGCNISYIVCYYNLLDYLRLDTFFYYIDIIKII